MLEIINLYLGGITVPILLIFCGVFFTVRLKFFYILHPIRLTRSLLQGSKNGISSISAVTLALAGTLGVGNIVGVSSAISLGGFGAIFWMWMSAIAAMALKYAETVLAIVHRKQRADGSYIGGAMYYIHVFFNKLSLPRTGKLVSGIFAVCFMGCALTMGSMLQSSAISSALDGVVGIPPAVTGTALALLTVAVIFRGQSRMLSVTSFLVPIMSAVYIILSLAVILKNLNGVGNAFYLIFSSAFSMRSAIGGIGGWGIMTAIRYGVMRGLISNEAGCGTAPTAHSIASCECPAKQGLWGIFEVFVDTVVLCTLTALAVMLEYDSASLYDGDFMMMTVSAFSASLGHFSEYLIALSVLCFGFATVICWSHYGSVCVEYFTNRPIAVRLFYIAIACCVFLGATLPSSTAWLLSDLLMGIMTVINLVPVTFMWRTVYEETQILFNKK